MKYLKKLSSCVILLFFISCLDFSALGQKKSELRKLDKELAVLKNKPVMQLTTLEKEKMTLLEARIKALRQEIGKLEGWD